MFSRDSLEKSLKEGMARAQSAIDSGISFVRSSVGQLPFFASVEATVQEGGVARDETHYFMVPYRLADSGYALYSTRRVPEGYADANDLARLRVFHLPGPGAETALE